MCLFFFSLFFLFAIYSSLFILFSQCPSPLLLQVSQIYQTMKIESLSQIIPFFDFSMVEKISVDAVKHNFIAMKVDHMKGVVLFGNMVS